jgi:hypothetical protein
MKVFQNAGDLSKSPLILQRGKRYLLLSKKEAGRDFWELLSNPESTRMPE